MAEVLPNAGGGGPGGGGPGGGGVPTPAANAFLGKPERVPEIAYIRERPGDGFLTSAKDYYEFFGITVEPVDSIVEILQHLGTLPGTKERVLIVSHAHPRGMIIPFFTNGVKGTNKDIFNAFAESDLRGLKLLSPFETSTNHLFNWDSIMGQLLSMLRGLPNASTVLTPFNLQTSGSPSGDLRDFFKFCFDIVYLRNPGRVRRNPSQAAGLTASQRTILENFVGAILNALKPGIITSLGVNDAQVQAVRTLITGVTYADLPGVGDFHPHLGLDNDNMNDFPTLQAAVTAVQGGAFRSQLNAARQKLTASSLLDVRGCRAGEDPEYVEALRVFFGRPGQLPSVTAPRHFQSYPQLAFQPPNNRGAIQSWLGATRWGHSTTVLREKFTVWAELIRVKPLHVDFWSNLFGGPAARFAGLQWRTEIPALFIPTPGLSELTPLTFNQIIGKIKDYFNVPNASVPSASTLSGMAALVGNLPTYNTSLLAEVPDSAGAPQLQTLYTQLRQINNDLAQSVVPATAPTPLTPAVIRQYQTGLNTFLDNTPLAPVKAFMTAAKTSLETGDGLYYYLLFAGLPVYVFGKPELSKNGIVVLDGHRAVALQSWYKCLWADALPGTGTYTGANISQTAARHAPSMVGEDRTSLTSICPLPRYMNCIRKRPMPPGEDESACGDLTGPF